MASSIEQLPHPIIEYIFSYLSPYRDLKQCLLVNKTWYDLVCGTIWKIRRDFHNAVTARNVCWEHCDASNIPSISRRYSHSSCVSGDSMYVFGGCTTACTTFNDLWRLDLGTRSWIRPLATGTYPPPKACASMVCFRENLILFGGWTHTSPYPLHQAWHIFNHLHIYNTNTNRWNQVVTSTCCPGMAGHTASMVGESMVVFGGLHCQSSWGPFTSSNDLWVLDVKTMSWRKQRTTSLAPHPRYGHSQITINDEHILIIGGCGGPNMLFSDVWLLKMVDGPNSTWEWKEVEVLQKENSAPQLTFHPACRVDSKVVVLSKAQWSRTLPSCLPQLLRAPTRLWVPPRAEVFVRPEPKVSPKLSDHDVCVNGKKGILKRHLHRSLPRRMTSNSTSSSDDEELHNNTLASKKGIIVNSMRSTSTGNISEHDQNTDIDLATTSSASSLIGSTGAFTTSNYPLDLPTTSSHLATPEGADSNKSGASAALSDNKLEGIAPEKSDASDIVADPIIQPSNDLSAGGKLQVMESAESESSSVGESENQRPNRISRPVLSVRPNSRRNRQRQLEGLDRMEQRIRNLKSGLNTRTLASLKPSGGGPPLNHSESTPPLSPKNPMCLYVMDIETLVEECRVTWIPPQFPSSSDLEEIILYSLVLGRGELIMFGGIQKDVNSYAAEHEKVPQTVSNSLHFISAFKYII